MEGSPTEELSSRTILLHTRVELQCQAFSLQEAEWAQHKVGGRSRLVVW
jgi:hypothetical protein